MTGRSGDRLVSRILCRRPSQSIGTAALVAAAVLAVCASAEAQGVRPSPPPPGCAPGASVTSGRFNPVFLGPVLGGGVAGADAVISAINTANTALLTQSSAFVSAPPNPKPDSQGGGVWGRGVGGNVDFKSNSTINFNLNSLVPTAGLVGCNAKFHENYIGFQVGQDLAKLNVDGWNLHLGQTAGYIETSGSTGDIGFPFSTETRVPFVGTYGAATKGNFFADALFRMNWFETSLNSPLANLNDQKLDAHGYSIAGSAGYRYDVPNSEWFWEPSVGLIWSRTSVDPLNVVSGAGGPPPPCGVTCTTVNGTVQINTIDSLVGRLGLRAGTSFVSGNIVYQPFAAVSVWHDFAGNIQANYTLCSSCFIAPTSGTATITAPNVGTYGQYSLGVNGQVVNTGWLGFARVDYRNGNRIEGWSGTGGIRYQYTPGSSPMDMAFAMVDSVDHLMSYAKVTKTAPVFVTKAKPMVERPYNWTGWYIGAFGGADHGNAHMGFPAAPTGAFVAGPQIAGALWGGTLGYNSEVGSWVWGIEGDIGGTNASGSVACAGPVAFPQPLFNTDCRDKADWIATLTGRLGLAWGRALYYVKAGGAWAHETFSVVCDQPPAGPGCVNLAGAPLNAVSAGDTHAGWTVGWGTEFGLTEKWSAKGEVDFIGLGRKNMTATDGTVINAGTDIWEGKIGVNYRLSP
jgi:outer membrane autotransporter protein